MVDGSCTCTEGYNGVSCELRKFSLVAFVPGILLLPASIPTFPEQ